MEKVNEQFSQLVDYVRQHLSHGTPEDAIRSTLYQYNWSSELVDAAFAAAKSTVPHPDGAPSPIQPHQASDASHRSEQPRMQETHQAHPSQHLTEQKVPDKYTVFRAIGDAFQAMKQNVATFSLAVLVGNAVAAGLFFLTTFLTSKLFYGHAGLASSVPKMLVTLIGSLVLYTLWFAVTSSFALVITSLAVYDGSEGRKGSLGATVSKGLSKLKHVAAANVLFALVSYWPVAFIIFLPIILLSGGHNGWILLLTLGPILSLVAIVWIIIVMMRFALVPYVAVFEPSVPAKETLKRSKYLLLKGGQWFLLKGFLLVLLVGVCINLLDLLTHQSLHRSSGTGGIFTNILFIATSILVNSVLVVLYRNRKLVRG